MAAEIWTDLMGEDIRILRLNEEEISESSSTASIDTVAYFNMSTSYLDLEGQPILVEEEVDLAAKIGDGDFLPGVELGLRHSRIGEHFIIRCHNKFAYGTDGRNSVNGCVVIPPNVSVSLKLVCLSLFLFLS
jgi:hypothetical protein